MKDKDIDTIHKTASFLNICLRTWDKKGYEETAEKARELKSGLEDILEREARIEEGKDLYTADLKEQAHISGR